MARLPRTGARAADRWKEAVMDWDCDYMSFREFMKRMGCNEQVARRILASEDRPPAHRYGRTWAISRAGYEEWRRELDARGKTVCF